MPSALERSYDGIIIGAGHHGLVLGSYLAKAGLEHERIHFDDTLLAGRRRTGAGGVDRGEQQQGQRTEQLLEHERFALENTLHGGVLRMDLCEGVLDELGL